MQNIKFNIQFTIQTNEQTEELASNNDFNNFLEQLYKAKQDNIIKMQNYDLDLDSIEVE